MSYRYRSELSDNEQNNKFGTNAAVITLYEPRGGFENIRNS